MHIGSTELGIMVSLLVSSFVFAGFCTMMAQSKGRDSIVWGLLGFFFNWVALIVLAFSPKKSQTPN